MDEKNIEKILTQLEQLEYLDPEFVNEALLENLARLIRQAAFRPKELSDGEAHAVVKICKAIGHLHLFKLLGLLNKVPARNVKQACRNAQKRIPTISNDKIRVDIQYKCKLGDVTKLKIIYVVNEPKTWWGENFKRIVEVINEVVSLLRAICYFFKRWLL